MVRPIITNSVGMKQAPLAPDAHRSHIDTGVSTCFNTPILPPGVSRQPAFSVGHSLNRAKRHKLCMKAGRPMFSESNRRNILLGSTGILLMVTACLTTILAYKQVVPSNVDRDTITITRADYEQALEKWRARKVAEYEITVRRNPYEAILRV